jgi:hypothetical protein
MKIGGTPVLVCFAVFSAPFVYASPLYSLPERVDTNPANETVTTSSNSSLPDAPDAAAIAAASSSIRNGKLTHLRLETRPFSAIAVGVTTGLGGIGFDVATPLATKINLRLSGSFLNYNPAVTADNVAVNAAITLRSVGAGVELFPYRSSFHITPGLTLYNGNHAAAVTNIAPGSDFTVNDTDYLSDAADPVHGYFDVNLGRKLAPSLTVGFGNMLRTDSHWSVPVDVGFQYVGQPKLTLKMTGSTCDPGGANCDTIANDPEAIADLAAEQAKINKEISPLRFYPIIKVGLSYRFGRNHKREYWY